MSWSFKIAGTPAAVKLAVQKQEYLPEELKQLAGRVCDECEKGGTRGLCIESHGHIGGSYSSVGRFDIAPVEIAAEPPPAVVEPVPASVAPVSDGVAVGAATD